jgi:hypothetical protein
VGEPTLGDIAERPDNRVAEAYRLAWRCARLAARMQPLHERLHRVGNLWAAADQGRLRVETRAAREEYMRLRRRMRVLERAYRSTWRELRQLQRGWTDDEWGRYRALVKERIPGEAGQPLPPTMRRVLAASAEPSRSLREMARAWWERLTARIQRARSS